MNELLDSQVIGRTRNRNESCKRKSNKINHKQRNAINLIATDSGQTKAKRERNK